MDNMSKLLPSSWQILQWRKSTMFPPKCKGDLKVSYRSCVYSFIYLFVLCVFMLTNVLSAFQVPALLVCVCLLTHVITCSALMYTCVYFSSLCMCTYRPFSLCSLPRFVYPCVSSTFTVLVSSYCLVCIILDLLPEHFRRPVAFCTSALKQLNLWTWPHLWVLDLSSTNLWYRILNEDNHDSKGWLYQTCLFFCNFHSGWRNYLSVRPRLLGAARGLGCGVWRVWLTWLRWTMIFTRSEF